MAGSLSLSEALKTDRLPEFISQAEAAGIGPAYRSEFDGLLGQIVKAPQPERQTSRSPARGGSPGK